MTSRPRHWSLLARAATRHPGRFRRARGLVRAARTLLRIAASSCSPPPRRFIARVQLLAGDLRTASMSCGGPTRLPTTLGRGTLPLSPRCSPRSSTRRAGGRSQEIAGRPRSCPHRRVEAQALWRSVRAEVLAGRAGGRPATRPGSRPADPGHRRARNPGRCPPRPGGGLRRSGRPGVPSGGRRGPGALRGQGRHDRGRPSGRPARASSPRGPSRSVGPAPPEHARSTPVELGFDLLLTQASTPARRPSRHDSRRRHTHPCPRSCSCSFATTRR